MCFCTISKAEGFFSINEMNSKPELVFVIGTIGEITTQSFFVLESMEGQVESMFSYGIDKTKTSLSLAMETLSLPVIFPFTEPYNSLEFLEYSRAACVALVASRD